MVSYGIAGCACTPCFWFCTACCSRLAFHRIGMFLVASDLSNHSTQEVDTLTKSWLGGTPPWGEIVLVIHSRTDSLALIHTLSTVFFYFILGSAKKPGKRTVKDETNVRLSNSLRSRSFSRFGIHMTTAGLRMKTSTYSVARLWKVHIIRPSGMLGLCLSQ